MATKKKKRKGFYPPAKKGMPILNKVMADDYKSKRDSIIWQMRYLMKTRKILQNTITGRKHKKQISNELLQLSNQLKKTRRAIHYYTR